MRIVDESDKISIILDRYIDILSPTKKRAQIIPNNNNKQ